VPAILIDQRSASVSPPDALVREWANGRRVFVSSLITDMPEERAKVRAAIEGLGATPVMFEDLGGQDIHATQAYIAGVRSSDIYVGAFGPRYGVRMHSGYSATHAEFLEAERQGLRLCIFVNGQDGRDMDGPQRDLIGGAQNLYTTSQWTTPADLAARVAQRLLGLAGEDLAPWIRVGRLFFRAKSITSSAQQIVVDADVRSNAVHSELVSLRDGRAGDLPFASSSEASRVQVSGLSTTTTSTAMHEEHLSLDKRSQQQSQTRMSMNGVSADQLAFFSLSDGLFGTQLLGQNTWGIRAEDPLQEVRSLGLDDAVLRPISRLLIAEFLLASDIAMSIDAFDLGPSHAGSRRLRVTWMPRREYVNAPDPSPVTLDGTLTGL
jgi:hypothetical protein